MRLSILLAALSGLAFTSTAHAQLTLDGLVSDLGTVVATDPIMDGPPVTNGEGGAGANGPMDLAGLYIAEDKVNNNVHFAVTVNTDLVANNWGKYKVYIKTNNGGTGGSTDPWGRAIAPTFGPQYAISTWLDGGAPASQLHKWNGGGWSEISGGVTHAVSGNGNGGLGGVEYRVSKANLGNPNTVQVIASCTGGGGGDNGQDSVPSNGNATDWGSMTTLSTPTSLVTVPVTVSGFSLD